MGKLNRRIKHRQYFDRCADGDPVALANRFLDGVRLKEHILWMRENEGVETTVITLGDKKWIRWCKENNVKAIEKPIKRKLHRRK